MAGEPEFVRDIRDRPVGRRQEVHGALDAALDHEPDGRNARPALERLAEVMRAIRSFTARFFPR